MKKFITFIGQRNITYFIEKCLAGEMILESNLKARPADKVEVDTKWLLESLTDSFMSAGWGPFSLSMKSPKVQENIKNVQIYSNEDKTLYFGVYLYELWGLKSQEELREVHEFFKFMGQEAFEAGTRASLGIDRSDKSTAKDVKVKLFVSSMPLELKIKEKIASSPVVTTFFDNQKDGLMHTSPNTQGLCASMGFWDIVDKALEQEYLDKVTASEPKPIRKVKVTKKDFFR